MAGNPAFNVRREKMGPLRIKVARGRHPIVTHLEYEHYFFEGGKDAVTSNPTGITPSTPENEDHRKQCYWK